MSNPLKSDTALACNIKDRSCLHHLYGDDTKVAGRLPAPPFASEVQLEDVGVCIHVPVIIISLLIISVRNHWS